MSDAEPYLNWTEPASKGDLIRAIKTLDAALLSLGLAVALIKAGKTEEAEKRLADMVRRSKDLEEVLGEIGGRVADGE